MNCIAKNSQQHREAYSRLRFQVRTNALKKLALEGGNADILDEAIIYRACMRELLGPFPEGKGGAKHIMLALRLGMSTSSHVTFTTDEDFLFKTFHEKGDSKSGGLIEEKRYKFSSEENRQICATEPFYEYSDDLKAYTKSMRAWLKTSGAIALEPQFFLTFLPLTVTPGPSDLTL